MEFNLYAIHERFNERGIHVPTVSVDTPVTYPSKWFDEHKQKPPLVVRKGSLEDLYTWVSECCAATNWDDIAMTSFMYYWMMDKDNVKHFTGKLDKDWISFSLQIGQKDDEVTPGSLLELDPGTDYKSNTPIQSTADDRKALFFYLLSTFRKTLTNQVDQKYSADVVKRMETLLMTGTISAKLKITDNLPSFKSPSNLTQNYSRLICAIDMFFFRFPNLEWASMRIATLNARYRGCVTLTSIQQLASLSGMKPYEMGYFMFSDALADELVRITGDYTHAADQYGYFPYALDLGIMERSPYSMTVNPTLHLFLHTFGCTMGFPRSTNARFPESPRSIPTVLANAIGLGLMLSSTGEYVRQFTSNKQSIPDHRKIRDHLLKTTLGQLSEESVAGEADKEEDIGPKLPDIIEDGFSKRASSLMMALTEHGGLSEEDLRRTRMRFKRLINAPNGSIGHYLYQRYVTEE